jgi:hypothetical protein
VNVRRIDGRGPDEADEIDCPRLTAMLRRKPERTLNEICSLQNGPDRETSNFGFNPLMLGKVPSQQSFSASYSPSSSSAP